MSLSSRTRVAVLRGGPSSEYDVSLKTGGHVLSLLREMPETYDPLDIFISKKGEWHRDGLAREPHEALRHSDVVWNALHGQYGEDGQVQRVLEGLQIPFTGSGAFASALSMNKDMTKRLYREHSLLTPEHEIINKNDFNDDQLIAIFRTYLHPVIVKPVSSGSSIGVHLANSFNELKEAIKATFKHSKRVLVEEFVRGKEATCGVVDNFRGEKHYALLPVEIRRLNNQALFDYDAKYSGKTEEICPAHFNPNEIKEIEEMAKKAHQALGLRHYSRSDFILTPKGKIYILETNSLPGFTQESLLPKSLHAVGFRPHDFVDHIIKIALK
ncbi:MAG: D-alanine--D-alanine ligase [Minisyncoccia bacterium]